MSGLSMGSMDPDDEGESVAAFSALIPKQVTPNEDLKNRVKLTTEAGGRKVMSAIDVMEDDEKLTWVIKDLLPDTGLIYLGGISGSGKTILAIQFAGDIILGKPTMTWQLGEAWHKDFTAMFFSLEMGKKELQLRLQHMYPNLTEEERKEFERRFLVYCEPEPFELWNPVHIIDLIRLIKAHSLNMLIIDSASVSFASSLKNDEQVNESIKNLYMLRFRMNVCMGVVAHTRKPDRTIASNPEDITLNELFGHSGVAQSASSILIMMEDEKMRKATIKGGDQDSVEKLVHIINAKSRFGANAGAFKAHLTSKNDVEKGQPLMFRRNAIPIEMTDEARRKIRKSEINLANTLGEAFGSLDDLGGD